MLRRTIGLLQTAATLLKLTVEGCVRDKIKLRKQKAKHYHDCTAKALPELDIKQDVKITPYTKHKLRRMGKCIEAT